MKIRKSLPEKEHFLEFFSRYADLIPGVYQLGFFSQIVSALTESTIIYAIVFSHLKDLTSLYSHLIALFAAILLSLTLEVGLRKFTPFSIRAILNKRFSGLDLYMSISILVITSTLLFFSGYLSFKGSKDLVEIAAPTPPSKKTDKIDSIHSKELSQIAKQYTSDSTQIFENYDRLLKAQENTFNSKIQVQQGKLRYYAGKEIETGRNYFSKKNQIQSAIGQLEVLKNDSLTALVTRRNQELQWIRNQKNEGFSKEKVNYMENQSNLAEENRALKDFTKGKVEKYGGFLAWFTIACLSFFLFSITLKEIHEKGSGIQHIAIPNQYFFEQGLINEFSQTLAEKIQCHARLWIKKWSEKTPKPPLPQPPPTLYDYSSLEQEIVAVTKELFSLNGSPITKGNTNGEHHKHTNGQTKEELNQNLSHTNGLTKGDQNKNPLVSEPSALFRHGPNKSIKLKEKEIETVFVDKSRTVEHYSASQQKTLYYTMIDVNGFIKKYQDRKTKAEKAYQNNPTKGNLKTLQNQEQWLAYWVGKREELEEKR